MVHLRLTGTPEECAAMVRILRRLAAEGVLAGLGEVSPPYPSRPPSTRARVYCDAALPRVPADPGGG